MSSIQQKIENLRKKLEEIEAYNKVNSMIQDLEETPPHIKEAFKNFCASQISSIETSEQLEFKVEAPTSPKPIVKLKSVDQLSNERAAMDPLSFISRFKDMQDKEVSFRDGAGNVLQGIIKGASFPNLKVLYNGNLITCNPNDLIVE